MEAATTPPYKSLPKSKTKPSALKKPSDIVICKSCLTIFRTKSGLTAHKPVCQNKEYGKDFNTFDLFEEGSDHPCPICLKNFTSTQLLPCTYLCDLHSMRNEVVTF